MKTNLFKVKSSNNVMKKLGIFAFLAIFVFGFGIVGAAMYSGGGNIYECGVINAPGVYALNQSFNFSGVGPCLLIFTGDVVIDGNGYLLMSNRSNETQGIFSNGFDNITITNLFISNFSVGLNFTDTSNVSLVDFNSSDCNPSISGTGSNISVSNYLDLTVLDQDGNPLNASNVTLFNNVTKESQSILTDENGTIPTQTLVDYTNNNSVITNMTYYMTAVLDGYTNYSYQFNITSNMDVNITLNDTVAPSLVLNSPSDGVSYTSNSQNVEFNFSADDLSNFSCVLYVGGNNYTNFNINGSEYLASDSFTPSTYNWNVNCTDSAGNSNVSSNRTFIVNAPVVATGGGGGDGGGWAAPPIVVNEQQNIEQLPINEDEGDEQAEEIDTGFLTGGAISPVTGAVVGTLGETGTLVLGLFATVLLVFAGVLVFKKAEWKKKKKGKKKE